MQLWFNENFHFVLGFLVSSLHIEQVKSSKMIPQNALKKLLLKVRWGIIGLAYQEATERIDMVSLGLTLFLNKVRTYGTKDTYLTATILRVGMVGNFEHPHASSLVEAGHSK